MFLWCHVRNINPVKIHPERIAGEDKKLANDLNYDGIEFPVQEKDFSKVETKSNICINVFRYEDKLTFQIHVSDEEFENSMDLLLVTDGDNSHYLYSEDFDRFMFHKTKNKNKKYFCKSCLQCFSGKVVLTKHKENCLTINGAKSVKLEKGSVEFKNYFKQIPVPFKIYGDFESHLKSVESYEGPYSKKYQAHDPCSFAYKLVCIDDEFTKLTVVFIGENAAYEFYQVILKEYQYCKKVIKKCFSQNLIMS